jgi:CBS-domain-containing membrane protein
MILENWYKPAEKLTTLSADRTMLAAAMQLDGAPFTHLPIIKAEESKIVTGVVDDLTIATYQHPLLLDCFEELSLDEIKTSITDENTVKPTDSIGDVIEKFLTITYPERPTAILVCTKDNNGEFVLQGIVSYTDLLKKFVLWKQSNNQPDNQG